MGQLSPSTTTAEAPVPQSLCYIEKPTRETTAMGSSHITTQECPLLTATTENPHVAAKIQCSQKEIIKIIFKKEWEKN